VVLDAVFPYARDHLAYPDLLEKGLEPHKVKEVWLWASEEPNRKIDVTGTFERKLEALRCHRSQMEGMREAEDWVRQRCREWARGTGFELAEAFYVAVAQP
jgi:LmbE family N-acetylglucosaminyl deacetylase